MKFRQLWDLETAMQVLGHQEADSETWAEAVEWLLLYGPPEIRKMLIDASETATRSAFPGLKPSHYTVDGQPCYNVSDLARHLGITEEEAREILRKKGLENELQEMLDTDDPNLQTIH